MSLKLDPIELGRLAILQAAPWRYIERRVESLELKGDKHYTVTVRQQLTMPFHLPVDANKRQEHDLLIPLGQFSKTRRPDMEVTGPDGTLLPIVHRDPRGRAIAILFTTSWQRELFKDKQTRKEEIEKFADVWDLVQYQVEHVAKRSRKFAHEAINDLRRLLVEARQATSKDAKDFITRLLRLADFWTELKALAETTIRIGELRGIPGETYAVTITYTERFRYATVAKSYLRAALSWLGLDCIPLSRSAANISQARSLWVIHSVPEGLEPLRFFWEDERHRSLQSDIGTIENDRAVVGRRTDSDSRAERDTGLLLDFQIAPSAAVFAAMALALILWPVAVYIYQRVPPVGGERTLLAGLAAAVAGVPATLAGALAYRGETFIRRASRGPRILLALLSAQATLLAIVLGLKTGHGHKLLQASAYVLSVYALSVFGIFGYIRFGPRWRKSNRTRWPARTRNVSPDGCRDRQMWAALVFCVVWTVVVVVFARCIAVLQHQSVFSKDFPSNVWHAWWSWFS